MFGEFYFLPIPLFGTATVLIYLLLVDNCVFGDVPTSDVGPSCQTLVDTTMSVCYNTTINRRCCSSCKEKATSFPGKRTR